MAKKNNEKFYKMRREDGEEFEVKEGFVKIKQHQGYELVSEEPIIRDTNTSTNGLQPEESEVESEETPEEEVQEEEEEVQQDTEEESEEDDEESLEDKSYNELQSYVSDNTEDYSVIGKSGDELLEKAKEISA